VVNCRDVTDRWRAEEELRDSEKQYRLLFHNNPNPMWVFDLETLAFWKSTRRPSSITAIRAKNFWR
jgi:PAS domain-containing protein